MERVGDRQDKMEGHYLTGQSSQWAVVPMEEEEDKKLNIFPEFFYCCDIMKLF